MAYTITSEVGGVLLPCPCPVSVCLHTWPCVLLVPLYRAGTTRDCSCIIHRTFGGKLRSDVVCTACSTVSTAMDPCFDVSLDIVQKCQGALRALRVLHLLLCGWVCSFSCSLLLRAGASSHVLFRLLRHFFGVRYLPSPQWTWWIAFASSPPQRTCTTTKSSTAPNASRFRIPPSSSRSIRCRQCSAFT
jgi:hypothetical protein